MTTATVTRTTVAKTVTRKKRDGSTMSKRISRNKAQAERNVRIIEDWENGTPQKEIAAKHGLTQGAISQIVRNPNAHLFYRD